MHVTDTHIYFWGDCIYSNFHPAPFRDTVAKLDFATSEHAYMWWKAHFFGDIKTRDLIAAAIKPGEAKKLGRQVRDFDLSKWDMVKIPFMTYVCHAKFSQNNEMAKEILATGDKMLVEASPIDRVWGVGLREDDPLILDEANWRGENLLGKTLVEVRRLLWEDLKGLKTPGHL